MSDVALNPCLLAEYSLHSGKYMYFSCSFRCSIWQSNEWMKEMHTWQSTLIALCVLRLYLYCVHSGEMRRDRPLHGEVTLTGPRCCCW